MTIVAVATAEDRAIQGILITREGRTIAHTIRSPFGRRRVLVVYGTRTLAMLQTMR